MELKLLLGLPYRSERDRWRRRTEMGDATYVALLLVMTEVGLGLALLMTRTVAMVADRSAGTYVMLTLLALVMAAVARIVSYLATGRMRAFGSLLAFVLHGWSLGLWLGSTLVFYTPLNPVYIFGFPMLTVLLFGVGCLVYRTARSVSFWEDGPGLWFWSFACGAPVGAVLMAVIQGRGFWGIFAAALTTILGVWVMYVVAIAMSADRTPVNAIDAAAAVCYELLLYPQLLVVGLTDRVIERLLRRYVDGLGTRGPDRKDDGSGDDPPG